MVDSAEPEHEPGGPPHAEVEAAVLVALTTLMAKVGRAAWVLFGILLLLVGGALNLAGDVKVMKKDLKEVKGVIVAQLEVRVRDVERMVGREILPEAEKEIDGLKERLLVLERK